MLLAFALFAILVLWGLKDGEIYAREALLYGSIFALCLGGFYFASVWPPMAYIGIGVICLLDVYLLYKFVGNPSVT